MEIGRAARTKGPQLGKAYRNLLNATSCVAAGKVFR
jgi:hypothetical protein